MINENDNDDSTNENVSDMEVVILQSIEECDVVPQSPRQTEIVVADHDSSTEAASILTTNSTHDASTVSSGEMNNLNRKEKVGIDDVVSESRQTEIVADHESSPEAASILTTDSTHDGSTVSSCQMYNLNRREKVGIDDAISMTVSDESEPLAERLRRIWIVALYLVTISILFADMNLLAPNLSTIADEFGMDEDERDVKLGGLIALGFFFVGAPVSFMVGWLADSINRSPLFAVTVFFGELGCLMSAFVQTYWQLYICRVMTGISVGGAIPVIYSVLGDMFPAKQRSAISAVVTTGTGLGMGIGQLLAGFVDSWRLPFLFVSIPGLVCSVLVFFVKDPKRGAKEAAVLEMNRHILLEEDPSSLSESDRREKMAPSVYGSKTLQNCGMECTPTKRYRRQQITQTVDDNKTDPSSKPCVSCNSTKEIIQIPSVVLTILQAAPGALPFGFCATFLNDYLQEQRGMSKENATLVLATFGAGNAIGVVIAGFLGHVAYKRDVRGPPFIMGISLILGCIPFYFLINTVDEHASTGVVAGVTVLSGILVVIPVPLERSILTNVCLPNLRGRANALVCIVDDLGKGLGPALVSLLITTFDRQTAFNISLIGWIIGGFLSLAITIFVAKDEESVQEQIREKLANADVECPSG